MEARDLMIGDWVHVEAHRGFNAQNVKVETIPDNDSDNKYGHHYGHIGTWLCGGDNDFRDVETKHLQPIPLTPEILEKNGFHKEWEGDVVLMVCDTIIVEIGDMYKVYKDGKMYLRRVLAPLYYVHELQHAMRLCGIEKEIIL